MLKKKVATFLLALFLIGSLTSPAVVYAASSSAQAKPAAGQVVKKVSKIKISGSTAFQKRITSILNLLHKRAPYYAQKVDTYIRQIQESSHSGVTVTTGIFQLGDATFYTQDDYWLASTIVHDAYHVELYQRGEAYAGREAESRCIQEQKKVLQQLGANPYYQKYLDNILSSQYWEIPLNQRNW